MSFHSSDASLRFFDVSLRSPDQPEASVGISFLNATKFSSLALWIANYSSSAVAKLALPAFRVFTKHPKISIVNFWVYEKGIL
jgi:hypothetical protein